MAERWNGHGAPPSQAAFNAALRADAQQKLGDLLRARPEPKLTDAELLASSEPLHNLLMRAEVQGYRRFECLGILHTRYAKTGRLGPSGDLFEGSPEGRLALLTHIGELIGVPFEP